MVEPARENIARYACRLGRRERLQKVLPCQHHIAQLRDK